MNVSRAWKGEPPTLEEAMRALREHVVVEMGLPQFEKETNGKLINLVIKEHMQVRLSDDVKRLADQVTPR